jgi:hypothetical protein
MLSAAARRSFGALLAGKHHSLQATAAATRGMALEGTKGFNEHEQAVENMYFNKVRPLTNERGRPDVLVGAAGRDSGMASASSALARPPCGAPARPAGPAAGPPTLLAHARGAFLQEDERLLRKILGKVKVQAEQDAAAAAHHLAAEEAALRSIVGKYKLSEVDIKALLEWKHAAYVRGARGPRGGAARRGGAPATPQPAWGLAGAGRAAAAHRQLLLPCEPGTGCP